MFSTRYQRKRTSEADKRGCFVCYKPTSLVLLNENPKADFFYCCESHLLDRGFAKPDSPPAALQKLDNEISDLKRDWDSVKPPLPPKPDEQPSVQSERQRGASPQAATPETPQTASCNNVKPVPQWYTIDAQIHRLRIQQKSQLARQKKSAALLRQPLPEAPTHDPN